MEDNQTSLVSFSEDDIGEEIELPNFARKYANKPTKIEKYEIHTGGVFDGRQSYYLKLITEVIATEKIKDKETKKESTIEIRAKRIFGLIYQDGKYSWSSRSELAGFLKKHKKERIQELIGLKVTTATQEKKDKEFLSFI